MMDSMLKRWRLVKRSNAGVIKKAGDKGVKLKKAVWRENGEKIIKWLK